MAFAAYGAEFGLGNQSVWGMAQDPGGILWVATEGGLFRFDGSRFELFSDTYGLPSTFVRCLAFDGRGNLWAGTDEGAAVRQGTRFLGPDKRNDLPAAYTEAMCPDHDGLMWIGTREGLWVQGRDGRMVRDPRGPAGHVTAICRSGGREMLAASSSGGQTRILAWDGRGWRPLVCTGAMETERIDAMVQDGLGRVWARSTTHLWRLDRDRFIPGPELPPNAQMGVLYADRKGRLWVPSIQAFHILDGDRWSTIEPRDGLPSLHYRCLLVDGEGTLWVAGKNVYRLLGGGWRSFTPGDGFPSATVWCITRDPDLRLLIGTDNGMVRWTDKGWAVVPGTETFQTRNVVRGPDGAFYLGGSPWVLRWDPATGKVTRLGPESGLKVSGRIFRMCLDREGRLWIGADGEGILRGELSGGRWRFTRESLPGGPREEVFEDVTMDGQGRIWGGGTLGLCLRENGAWRRFGTRDGLRGDVVRHVRPLANGDLLAVYEVGRGTERLRYEGGKLRAVENYDTRLPMDQLIYLVGEDATGTLWIGTGDGLYTLPPGGIPVRQTIADGLPDNDTNNMAFRAEPDGDVWIGTSGGLARFDHRSAPAPPAPPTVAILAVRLGDQERVPPFDAPLAMPRGADAFFVHYASPSYSHRGELQIQSRLEGLDPIWRATDRVDERFLALRPADYTFEVRARIGLGPWGPVARVPFRVKPRAWRTPLACVAYVLGLGGCLFFLVSTRLRILQRRNEILGARVEAATREIRTHEASLARQAEELACTNQVLQELNEQKNQFFGIVAHDLRNPLNTIVLSAQLLDGERVPEEVDRNAREILREGMDMSALIGRFLDIAAIESGKIEAELAPFDLGGMTTHVMGRFRDKARTKDIALRFEGPEGACLAWGDAKFTKEALDNLISNAVKFSPPGRPVTVRLEPMGPVIRVSVEDQGPGLTPEDRVRLFGRFARLSARPTGGEKSTGLGLSIVKHMVDAMGGRIWVDSEPGQGAAFRVELPTRPADPGPDEGTA
jgi:signal transduction histidine kinase/ligand-binding sensor domain-containing protein